MLFDYAHVAAGQTVLIHGAAGNVGAYAVQMASQAGLHVVATASTPDLDYVRNLGAERMEMNRDLQTTAEAAYAVRPYSLTGSLWWLLPPAAALFYPLALRALYESGQLLHRASGPDEGVAFLAIVVSAGLIYSVPAVGIVAAYLFGRDERTSPSELIARRLAHLAVATPSLFVLIGVIFFMRHTANGDLVFWSFLWLIAIAVAAWAMLRQETGIPATTASNPIPVRMAHGTSALLILVIFLGWHLLNHASAAFSPELNQAMMVTLRKWYRSELVQPVLVILMLFQVVSGGMLLWRATAGRSDLYRTLQTCTGAFLTAFIVSHLNSVFILGRTVTKVDTTFLWASGAPVGLLPDAWNVRLIPHYSLGVWFVIAHMGLGLRGVLLAHEASRPLADRFAGAVVAAGTVFAVTITIAQLSVHGAS